jgi:hypothetical protein
LKIKNYKFERVANFKYVGVILKALEWNPQGKRRRGRPKNMWRRMMLEEAK